MIIGIDFDGTMVKHEFPEIGDDVPHAIRVMRRLLANGHKIILWTMRSDPDEGRQVLTEATNHIMDVCDIELFGVNKNPDQDWSNSPKAYCQIYIDDAALGCPLIKEAEEGVTYIPAGSEPRPYVDWLAVEQQLAEMGLFPNI